MSVNEINKLAVSVLAFQ